jgi:hypothetical protein
LRWPRRRSAAMSRSTRASTTTSGHTCLCDQDRQEESDSLCRLHPRSRSPRPRDPARRPRRLDRLLHLRSRLNPSRCHRITVAGPTIARPPSSPSTAAREPPRRLGPTYRAVDLGHHVSGSAPRSAIAAPDSRERVPAASGAATSSSPGGPRGDSTRLRPYRLNTLRLKASLQDELFGKHKGTLGEAMRLLPHVHPWIWNQPARFRTSAE